MTGVSAEANFAFNTLGQQPFIDKFRNRTTVPFDGSHIERAQIEPVKSHVSLILEKLFIIFLLLLVAILGLITIIIGAIAYTRNCYSPRQPSIPIWLLVLGGMSIILVSILTLLIILSTTCQYKSSDKKFRIAFIITIGVATALLGWANAPGTRAAFNLSKNSITCLGFIYTYSVVLYFILIICSFICSIYAIYKNRDRICCGICKTKKENQISPIDPAAVNQTEVIQTIPLSCSSPQSNTAIGTTTPDGEKEERLIEGSRVHTEQEMTSLEHTPVIKTIETNPTEKAPKQS